MHIIELFNEHNNTQIVKNFYIIQISDDLCVIYSTSTHSTRKGNEIFYRDMCFKLKKH